MKVLRYEITDACNLRCKMCWSVDWQHKDMGIVWAKKLINEFADLYPGQMIILTSREPFASSIFEEVVTYAKNRGLNIGILTNGTMLNEKIEKCISKNEISAISISVHGDEQHHDLIVGVDGAARKTVDALDKIAKIMKCKESDFCLRITNVLSTSTMQALDYLINLAKKDSAVLRLQHLMWHSERQKQIHKKYMIDKYNIKDDSIDGFLASPSITADEVIDIIDTAKLKCSQNNVKLEIYPNLSKQQIIKWYNEDDIVFEEAICSHAKDSIRVRADGSVVYCQYVEHKYGDIKKSSLADILESTEYKRWSEDMNNGCLMPLCQRCCHVCAVDKREMEYVI